ncbi:HDIG domain-containing protein [Desulfurococcaceae archaeon MEX13E-LK6-19]|nr:HDIG domain-containing protein [Desulfurococcaceae archaeon MEX13E-LK6-19]
MISRSEALDLLKKNLRDEKMVKHCLAVEAIMRAVARRLGENEELWGLIGLLHDIDYDIVNRDLKRHGLEAMKILEGILPREAIEAIAAHNEHNGFKPTIPGVEKIVHALRAADHLSGLIIATALVMPHKKIEEIKLKSLKKKYRSKDFAKNIDRNRIKEIEELGISLDEFMEIGLNALKEIAGELGL